MIVSGRKALVFGDLHISDVYKGNHVDYLSESFGILGQIMSICRKENPDIIFMLGDLDLQISRRQVLMQFCKFFSELNMITNGNVFCVQGNHDMVGSFSVFSFLSGLGYIKIAKDSSVEGYVDLSHPSSPSEPSVRFHMVDYGMEDAELNLLNKEYSNIVLAHNNFIIPGCTNWYQEHDGIELSRQRNWVGVPLVISGHIHNPSPDIYAVELLNGGVCQLFYPGCPTRPSKDQSKYDKVYYVCFEFEDESNVSWEAKDIVLPPADECFIPDDSVLNEMTEDEIEEKVRKEKLEVVLDEIMTYRIAGNDFVTQINSIPNASSNAKRIAVSYLSRVTSEEKA